MKEQRKRKKGSNYAMYHYYDFIKIPNLSVISS